MELKIYGSSDDLIEIDGDFREEFNVYEDGYLCFSDGTILSTSFDKDGIWRFKPVRYGQAKYYHVDGLPDDDENYTDRVRLTCDIFHWISWSKDMRLIHEAPQ